MSMSIEPKKINEIEATLIDPKYFHIFLLSIEALFPTKIVLSFFVKTIRNIKRCKNPTRAVTMNIQEIFEERDCGIEEEFFYKN